ncbi:MAG: adenosylmethionine decarboxylase [Anaerovibrio sp.]|uniref:adenosylmethionine decarboxylase n=1 Tax=Anaerovibrio sp. TaxID=1872532 RepID=UPI0025F38071|nr:adenosylmethionine decarboxylase [Anaerovibrio sp.]MCR5177046.1 adenosylmethionine decarboxylase [Anaerovibrio sp.]
MNIIARHITVDMYKCKNSCFDDMYALQTTIKSMLMESNLEILSSTSQMMPDEHIAIVLLFNEGHITVHAFPELQYVSADAFLCEENAAPEQVFSSIKKLFKPEKTKTTILKRGDFGKNTDMKPKTKTKVAPLRRIHNTGSKVIKMLAKSKEDNKNE